jgi:hypothetical protein
MKKKPKKSKKFYFITLEDVMKRVDEMFAFSRDEATSDVWKEA